MSAYTILCQSSLLLSSFFVISSPLYLIYFSPHLAFLGPIPQKIYKLQVTSLILVKMSFCSTKGNLTSMNYKYKFAHITSERRRFCSTEPAILQVQAHRLVLVALISTRLPSLVNLVFRTAFHQKTTKIMLDHRKKVKKLKN